jgi:cation diffusion facilitator CzcD-associated flavoprotein CzcO
VSLEHAKPTVGVIGAGPGGIAMGSRLNAGGYDFTIFDRASGFGGTWRNNTYPGAACDVPSHFYSFSFALNPRWSKTYANQPEILDYLERVAVDSGLADRLVANTRVTELRWSDADQRWTVVTDSGTAYEFDVVVSAVGMLDVPNIPDIQNASAAGHFIPRRGITRNRLQGNGLHPSAPAPARSSTFLPSQRTPSI